MLGNDTFYVLLLLLCLVSCTEKVDFDQANDFQVSPVIESSLIFLDEPASQFVEEGTEIVSIRDEVLLNIFNDQFIVDNLIKAEFVFEITNSINRNFRLQVHFLDESDQVLHILTISVMASPNNEPFFQTYIETFEGSTLMALKATQKMDFTLDVLQGSPLTENSKGDIQLKSKGVFYFKIDSSL